MFCRRTSCTASQRLSSRMRPSMSLSLRTSFTPSATASSSLTLSQCLLSSTVIHVGRATLASRTGNSYSASFRMVAMSSSVIFAQLTGNTASSGMNLGSTVIIVRPAPLCGSSSRVRSLTCSNFSMCTRSPPFQTPQGHHLQGLVSTIYSGGLRI